MTFTHKLMPLGGAPFYSYEINYSCLINDNDTAVLSRTVSAANDRRTCSFSIWTKRANMGLAQGLISGGTSTNDGTDIRFSTGDQLDIKHSDGGAAALRYTTNMVFRDPTSWYHIFITFDTTDATAGDRIRIWVNGLEITSFSVETNPALNKELDFESTSTGARIGRGRIDTAGYYDGYFSEIKYISGSVETVTDYGEFKNNVWIPKSYSPTYGSNGYYLDFSNSSHFGEDQSGNGNDFTDSGLTTADQVIDTPTNNYCVLNPIDKNSNPTLSNGNLTTVYNAAFWRGGRSTKFTSTGKWYFEFTINDNDRGIVGLANSDYTLIVKLGTTANGWGLFWDSGGTWKKIHNVSEIALGGSAVNGDIGQIAWDMDAGKMWLGANNVWFSSGDPAAGTNEIWSDLSGDLSPAYSHYNQTGIDFNFGQLGFTYTPPSGFLALCSANMTDPSIPDATQGFYANTRTGTGAEATISDVGFDVSSGALIWIKNRDATDSHNLVDTERGATFEINSDLTAAETTVAQGVKSFTSSGYVIGTDNTYNTNTENYIDWVFRKGATYGFDIVTFTGSGVARTISHDLLYAPELILVKNLSIAAGWSVYHHLVASDPETDYAKLNLTDVFTDSATIWNDTAPTSTVFSVGTNSAVNGNGNDIVAYLFRSIPGFSKVFAYTGNGNADGPYIGGTDFRSGFILSKRAAGGANNWGLYDFKRPEHNPIYGLWTNENYAENTANTYADITSHGIKIRSTSTVINASGSLYVGIAIAEQAGKWSNAR